MTAPLSFFDRLTEADLRRRRGVKWTQYPPDVLPMWIADQDFPPAPPIQRVLDEMVAIGDLGYPVRPWLNPLPALFAQRQTTRNGWSPDPARVRVFTDVLNALEASLLHHGSRGDGAIGAEHAWVAGFERKDAKTQRRKKQKGMARARLTALGIHDQCHEWQKRGRQSFRAFLRLCVFASLR